MEENNKLFNENEFINILNEPESTLPDDIILGGSCTLIDACSTTAGDACSDACDSDGGACMGDSCTSDGCRADTAPTTYYYALQVRTYKSGYYIPTQLPEGAYDLYPGTPVGFWYHSVSAANPATAAILANGFSSNTGYNITTAHIYTFAASGTTNTAFINPASTMEVAGYVFLSASATNRRFSNTIAYPLTVYAKLWPSSQYSDFIYNYNRLATGEAHLGATQHYYLKEKTFSIYTKYNNIPVQGCLVNINNIDTYFPQYFTYAGYKILTGYDGGVILSTSSVTGTTISGFINRIGFNGNSNVNFTATADTVCTVNLSHTSNLEKYELPLYDMLKTNPMLDSLTDIYYDGGVIGITGPSLTKKLLSFHGFSTETTTTIDEKQFIRAYDLIRTKPALSYFTNDPLIGKFSQLSYTISNDITITTALTLFQTFSWNKINAYQFQYPTIIKTGTTSSVTVKFYATTTVNGSTFSNVLLKTVICTEGETSASQLLSLDVLTTQHGSGTGGDMNVAMYVKKTTNTGTLKLKSGTYHYTETSEGGNTPSA